MVVGIPGSIRKPTDHPKAQPDEKLENVKRLGESHLYTEPELEKKTNSWTIPIVLPSTLCESVFCAGFQGLNV